ncbi:MAG: hypothetical protein WDM76_04355 [Limisphaerales bacterium]
MAADNSSTIRKPTPTKIGTGILDVDVYGSGGANAYRSNNPGLATENAGGKPRPAYSTGLQDYDVGFNDGGSGKWGNYTRTFPAGVYNFYMRAANPNSFTTGQRGHGVGNQRARHHEPDHSQSGHIFGSQYGRLAGLHVGAVERRQW